MFIFYFNPGVSYLKIDITKKLWYTYNKRFYFLTPGLKYMPRRTFEPWVHHVYNRWLEKMTIFKDKSDFHRFYKLVAKYSRLDKYAEVKILSFSFLPNHFHFIVNNPGVEISSFFWDIQNSYAKYFNIKYWRKWQLFEWRFKAKLISDQDYLEQCLAYVNFNAVKHWIVDKIEDYEWTSYHHFVDKPKIDKYKDISNPGVEFDEQ